MAEVKMALNENTLQVATRNASGAEPKYGLEFNRYFTDGKVSPFDAGPPVRPQCPAAFDRNRSGLMRGPRAPP